MKLKELTQEEYKLINGGSEASEGAVYLLAAGIHLLWDAAVATFVDGCRSY